MPIAVPIDYTALPFSERGIPDAEFAPIAAEVLEADAPVAGTFGDKEDRIVFFVPFDGFVFLREAGVVDQFVVQPRTQLVVVEFDVEVIPFSFWCASSLGSTAK